MNVFGGQAASGSAAAGAAAAAFTCSSSAIRDCCGGPSNTRSHKSQTLSYSKSAYAKATPYCAPYVPKSATLGRMGTTAALRSTCDLVDQSQQDHPTMNCHSSSQTPEQILWQFNCDVMQQKRNNPDLVHRTPGCNNVLTAGGGAGTGGGGGNVGNRTTSL